MSAPTYMHRVLRNRETGEVSTVAGEACTLLCPPLLRLKLGNGKITHRMPLAEILAQWEWVEGVVALPTAPAVMALPANVVPFMRPGAGRHVPIQPGPAGGSAA